MTGLRTFICAAGFGTLASVVVALGPSSYGFAQPSRDGEYQGVAPGRSHRPPRAPGADSRRIVTWPGFQMLPNGGSRFFLQVNGSVETQTSEGDGTFTVTLRNARIHLINNHRPLVTTYFNTPVRSARLVRKRGGVAMVMSMRTGAVPTLTTEAGENGYHYLYIDFPPGQFDNL